LNRGIPFIEGQLAVFTDDDIIPDRDWLSRLWAASQLHRGFNIFGGHVRANWPGGGKPTSLSESLLGPLYALTKPGLPEGPVEPHLVMGPNMAVRTSVFDAGHRFDVNIGPDGSDDYAMGSETSFVRYLAMCGYRAWHVPAARVQHVVRAYQLDRRWILRRARRFGRGQCRWERQFGAANETATLLGYPRWILRRVIDLKVKRLLQLRHRRNGEICEADWEYFRLLGYALETKALAKRQPQNP
jgi:hypothetical protein